MSIFRVTVEDLETGGKQALEVHSGDYLLIPFAPCYLETTQTYPLEGRHVITVKGHAPAGKPKTMAVSDVR